MSGLRTAVITALEGIDAGDVDYAVAVLRSALVEPARRPQLCQSCGTTFRWPGELEHHLQHVHGIVEVAA